MAEIVVREAHEISLDAYAEMQRASFQILMKEMGVSDEYISPAFFRWKYFSPFGRAKLVLAVDGDKMLSATMIYPLILQDGKKRIVAWQNGDTATIPEARNQGLYSRCMKGAVDLVRENEIIFGFPNKNSVRGFSCFVETDKGVLPLFAKVSPLRFRTFGGTVSEVDSFGEESIDFERLQRNRFPAFEKNNSYLNWRYVDHPLHEYFIFVSKNSQNTVNGYIVARNAKIQGHRIMLVMELLGESRRVESRLLKHAISSKSKGVFVMMFSSMYSDLDALYLGMVRVPGRFVPKRQVLFASAQGDDGKAILRKNWRLQMGDWDGF